MAILLRRGILACQAQTDDRDDLAEPTERERTGGRWWETQFFL